MDIKKSFEEYFREESGFDLSELLELLKNFDNRCSSPVEKLVVGKTKSSIIYMINRYKVLYKEYLLPENPDFNDYLLVHTEKRCSELYEIARATGNYKSYEKMIDWYKNRFILLYNNPFIVKDAETSRKGEENV